MRYVAAYLLAQLGGNNDPSLADVKKILGSVGIDGEDDKANKVIASLKGKNVEELIEKGKQKLASVPSAAAVAGSAAPSAAAAGGSAPAKEEKKEEKKKEEKEESDDDMGFGLFD